MSAYKTNALGSDYVAGGAYPAEMRSRFLRDLEEHSGRTFVICRQHRIAESTGYKWIKDWEEGGRLEARARGTPPPPARRRRPLAAAARSPPPPARRRHPLAQPKPIYNRPLPQAGARGASSPDNLAWFAQFVAAKALDSRVTAGVIAEKFAAHTSSIIRGSSTTPYSASRANLSCIILYRTLVLLGPNSSDYAKYFCTLSLSERTPVIRI
jgi:transposase-like protein